MPSLHSIELFLLWTGAVLYRETSNLSRTVWLAHAQDS